MAKSDPSYVLFASECKCSVAVVVKAGRSRGFPGRQSPGTAWCTGWLQNQAGPPDYVDDMPPPEMSGGGGGGDDIPF